jgi:hypothetical protein
MTSANSSQVVLSFLVSLGCLVLTLSPSAEASRRYGPTSSGGYYIRVEPGTITMAHSQRPRLTVTVEDAAGTPVDNVPVSFTPSEGVFTAAAPDTRGGTVTGTFTAATGSDSPRHAFVVVTVDNFEVTVFIEIVPAVFGR